MYRFVIRETARRVCRAMMMIMAMTMAIAVVVVVAVDRLVGMAGVPAYERCQLRDRVVCLAIARVDAATGVREIPGPMRPIAPALAGG